MVYPPDTIMVGDTVPITVEALNRSGSVIPGAPVFLGYLTNDTLSPKVLAIVDSVSVAGLPFDTTTASTASGELVAGVENLRGAPFRIVVRAP